jgi:hypothetical protein
MATGLEIIGAGITAVKAASEVTRIALDLTRHPRVDGGAVEAKLIELQGLIISAQSALVDAKSEIQELVSELAEARRIADFGKDFEFDEGVYWYRNYPYCPNCWDAKRVPIRLDGPYSTGWKCPIHNSNYFLQRRPV